MTVATLETPLEAARDGRRPALRTETLAHSVAFMLALVVAQRLIGFVRGVLFCRWLDPAVLGEWEMALAFLSMAAPLAVLGVPGCFGRYIEHYRQSGQLAMFLRRATAFTAVAVLAAIVVLNVRPAWVSFLVFDRPDQIALVGMLTASLAAVAFFNYVSDLFTSLRLVRWVSVLQVVQGVAFAGLGIGLVLAWEPTSLAVVTAYGASCVAAIVVGVGLLWRMWPGLPADGAPLHGGAIWRKLLPFAAAVWVTNALGNLFALADRYVILHACGLSADDSLALIGNYHSARLLPTLLASTATMVAGVTLPHLSADWEAGRRRAVSDQTNLILKLLTFALLGAAVVMLLAGPLMFDVLFRGKFAGGLGVLPWMLACGVWMALFSPAYNFAWCAERAALGSLVILAGLVVNVGLNMWLVPLMELPGAVLATATANLLVLLLIYGFGGWLGLRMDRGVWACLALPLLLCLDPLGALVGFLTACWLALRTAWFFSPREQERMSSALWRSLARFVPARWTPGEQKPR